MRKIYVLRDGELVEKNTLAWDTPGCKLPYVVSDSMPMTLNHADGRRYDSKRAYERAVRAAGCEIVGNEKLPPRQEFTPTGIGADIKRAIEELS